MSDWNTKIIEEFRANEGRVGGPFEGDPMILIHHVGARSGTERVTPLVSFPQDDGRIVIIASKAGAPTNPDWYHNLKAHPEIEVEVGTETFPVRVTEAEGAEREEIWSRVVAAKPGFGEYQEKTTRTIPVLVLSRAA
ncbi:nitroreductase family deazaflavin-dependent oxidoreductase [Pseudonocardia sp.]|uniref:nitroreductase family deazaflavin-dependent oxidoreductase n=1 Tax=Pseudonocardia sp. TaxID=60912 RepID=UPI00260EAA60|nr:nitroreductase family deazaflavin-dependent oxidoreductase [Pseudonocardia sp.]